jgi:hypothetical protein
VIPAELRELPPLRDFEDEAVLGALAARFERQDFGAGDVIAEFGSPAIPGKRSCVTRSPAGRLKGLSPSFRSP